MAEKTPLSIEPAGDELKNEVNKYVNDIKASWPNDLASSVALFSVVSLREVRMPNSRKVALVVTIPYRVFKPSERQVHSRFVAELEKKTNKPVILLPQRSIIPKNFRRRGIDSRTTSRTLTAVHEAILEDVVAPTDIVGKRTLMKSDGSKVIKVYLDPRDKQTIDQDEKIQTFAAVYKALTNKEAVFLF